MMDLIRIFLILLSTFYEIFLSLIPPPHLPLSASQVSRTGEGRNSWELPHLLVPSLNLRLGQASLYSFLRTLSTSPP
jgi:hypothetical protein